MLIEDNRTRKRRVYDWWSRYPRLLDVLYIVAFLGREDAFRRRAIETLDLTPGERVLEVGCGNGNSFASLRDGVSSGGTIVGLDVSRGMVRSARDRTLNGKHRNLHVVRGDAKRLPFPPGTFDTSYASMSLSAVPDPKRTIDAVETVLRPGGRFVVLDAQPFQQSTPARSCRSPPRSSVADTSASRWPKRQRSRSRCPSLSAPRPTTPTLRRCDWGTRCGDAP